MFDFNSKFEYKDPKQIDQHNQVGQVKDSPQTAGGNTEEIPAVTVSREANVFTANQLYGNTTNPEDVSRIGSSASLFTSTYSVPNQTNPINSNSANNGLANVSTSGQRSDIQQTATSSALRGVTGNGNVYYDNPSQIMQNMYDKYNKHLNEAEFS